MKVRALQNVLASGKPLVKGQIYDDLSPQDEKILLNMGAVERVESEAIEQKEQTEEQPKKQKQKRGK
jgi:hypothetical protein